MIIIYTTFGSKQEANKIVSGLIKEKLVACANIFPIESMYLWQGKVKKDKEYAAYIKTSKKNYKKVEKYIIHNHNYKVPCIMEIPLGLISKEYQQWLNSCINK